MVCTITHCCSLFPATPLEQFQSQRLIRVEYHAITQPLCKTRWVCPTKCRSGCIMSSSKMLFSCVHVNLFLVLGLRTLSLPCLQPCLHDCKHSQGCNSLFTFSFFMEPSIWSWDHFFWFLKPLVPINFNFLKKVSLV